VFSNIDEHVRRMLRRPAGQELHPDRSQERAMLVPCDGRHLGPRQGLRIERAAAGTGPRDWKIGRSAFPFQAPPRGVRGSISAEPPRADKAAALFHPCSARAWWPNGPKPAACRQARGRWRPDDRKVVRRRPGTQGGNTALGDVLEVERRRVFPRRWAESLRRRRSSTTGARDAKRRL
jgi:hypothetical protein